MFTHFYSKSNKLGLEVLLMGDCRLLTVISRDNKTCRANGRITDYS